MSARVYLPATIRATKKAELVAVIERAARHGDICPSGETLAKEIGISASLAGTFMSELQADKVIAVTLHFLPSVGRLRQVHVLASGLKTRKPEPLRPRGMPIHREGALVAGTPLERAKRALMRRGCVVHERWRYDKDAPRGVVTVDGMMLTEAEVIARAGRSA
jgi:hypothetical protein